MTVIPLVSTGDPLLDKADDFTATEVTTLDLWLAADKAGLPAEAKAILETGLRVEHYRSLLDADPTAWTDDQHSRYAGLQHDAAVAIDGFNAALSLLEERRRSASPLQGSGAGDPGLPEGYGVHALEGPCWCGTHHDATPPGVSLGDR